MALSRAVSAPMVSATLLGMLVQNPKAMPRDPSYFTVLHGAAARTPSRRALLALRPVWALGWSFLGGVPCWQLPPLSGQAKLPTRFLHICESPTNCPQKQEHVSC